MYLKAYDLNQSLMTSQADKPAGKFFGGLVTWTLLVLVLFSAQGIKAQGWEMVFGGALTDWGQSVIETSDHGYVIAGFSESFPPDQDLDVYVIKTDVDGTLVWQKNYDHGDKQLGLEIIETTDGDFIVVGSIIELPGDIPKVYLLKIDKTGKEIFHKSFANNDKAEVGNSVIQLSDGGFAIIGSSRIDGDTDSSDILVLRTDENGTELWRQTYGTDRRDFGEAIVKTEEGFFIAGTSRELNNFSGGVLTDIWLAKLGETGDTIYTKRFGDEDSSDAALDLIVTQAGKLVLSGIIGDEPAIALFDLDGEMQWTWISGAGTRGEIYTVIEKQSGELVGAGYRELSDQNSDIYLVGLDGNGALIWSNLLGEPNKFDEAAGLAITRDNGLVITGTTSFEAGIINDVYLIRTDATGNTITNHIKGRVYQSTDGCNNFTSGDLPMPSWIVKAEGTANTYFGTTDADGNFDITVDTGSYTVTILRQSPYWDVCDADGQQVDFGQFYSEETLSFPIEPATECSYLEVDVSAEFLAPCSDVTYTVSYCNIGTLDANDAYVDVTLDSEMVFNSAELPEEALGNNVYRFQLGDIGVTGCGSFTISVAMDCEGIATGQAGMVSAHIFPDAICGPTDPNWDGTSIIVGGRCENDSIKFSIKNVTSLQMGESRMYIITEDDVMFLNGPQDFQLPPNGTDTITIPATGATYRLIAQQSAFHPGSSNPTVVVEGCITEGSEQYSTGFVSQFPEDDQDNFVAFDVQEIIDSGTPASMRGYPSGFMDASITANTDLVYTIFFENTGIDTIDRVVIRDTISPNLDITSVIPGASSHPYDFKIYNTGVLKITFEEIQLLPGSSAEEAASRGFVKFRIAQKPNNPQGTIISNSAAVFFDYEAPVQTNQVVRQVGCQSIFAEDQDCLDIVSDVTNPVPGVTINVYPNPFFESTTFEIKGIENEEFSFKVFDLFGRLLRSDQFSGAKYDFYRHQLPAGLYVYQIGIAGQLISSGKITVR
ncbi:MAG: hypothetical protein DHS20C18_45310 [Saprospiraceae bacterium]|nr:MAG: hypothetical protein DHS20C18_45310 [Saprospiraceae bacterium]